MSQYWLRLVTCIFLFGLVLRVKAQPLYPLSDKPYSPLPAEITDRIFRDWSTLVTSLASESKPDRSMRHIWVRMFPVLSSPLGDPYPETRNLTGLNLTHGKGFKVFGLDDEALLGEGTSLRFDFATGLIVIGSGARPLEPVWIAPLTAEPTLVQWDKGSKAPNGKSAEVRVRLRGGFVVRPSLHHSRKVPSDPPQILWSLINVVRVNDYLKSVVPSEVIASWQGETLRAQAIAARTYGMYEVSSARLEGLDFDVDPTTWYQSYQGYQFWNRDTGAWRTVELKATSGAVDATGGLVILHGREVIKAYFSANSGGRTCLATECFENEVVNPPFIHEVNDHPSIRSAPGGTWGGKANLTSSAIKTKLEEYGLEVNGTVTRVEHSERGQSGRTWRVRLRMKDGRAVELDRYFTKKVMHLFGPIRSFSYELGAVAKDGKQKVAGHGYGHAVGMSQWGAQLYAKQGWSAGKILKHFYRDVTIQDLSGGAFPATSMHNP